MTQTDTTTPDQSKPGSKVNEEVLHIPQSSKTGASPSDGLVSYSRHSLGERYYPSVEMKSAHSTSPTKWTERVLVLKCIGNGITTGIEPYKNREWGGEGDEKDIMKQ